MAPRTVKRRRVVVDGSNIATEGRSAPSLAQLDQAIRSFLEEYPGFTTADVTVVVDATFGHRIDPSERREFDQAIEHGEMVTPPAGAVGRGDGFILRIAEKSEALVLSNDSFQEFHAERPWLFDSGRLIGGKPVPGVGWVFTPRTPVRGPRSRSVTAQTRRTLETGSTTEVPSRSARSSSARAGNAAKGGRAGSTVDGAEGTKGARATRTTKAAKATKVGKATKAESATRSAVTTKAVKATAATKAGKVTKTVKATRITKASKAAKGTDKATRTAKVSKPSKAAKAAKAAKPMKAAGVKKASGSPKSTASTKAVRGEKKAAASSKRSSDGATPSGSSPTNDPATFFNFVAEHPVGSSFEGTVTAFTSHGAHVDVDGMQGHVPLRGLGDPPPQRARQVLTKGERRRFSLVALDPARRRAELTLAN